MSPAPTKSETANLLSELRDEPVEGLEGMEVLKNQGLCSSEVVFQ